MGGTHYWAQSLQVVHMWYMVVQGSSWNEQLNSSSFLVGPVQAPLWAQLKLRGGPNSSSLVGPAQAPWWAQLKLPGGPSSSSLVGPAQAPWWAQLKLQWAQLIPEQICMVYSVWCIQQPLCGEVYSK